MIDLSTGKPMTRRTAIKGGLAAIIAAGCAPRMSGGVLRRGLGAHNALVFGSKPTAMDYVQEGLVAMWDGIENAGFGQHDPSASVWKNIKNAEDSSRYISIDRLLVESDAVHNNVGTVNIAMGFEYLPQYDGLTVELCENNNSQDYGRGFSTIKFRDPATNLIGSFFDSKRSAYLAPPTLQSYFTWPTGLFECEYKRHSTLSFVHKNNRYSIYNDAEYKGGGNADSLSTFSTRSEFRFWYPTTVAPSGCDTHAHCIRIYNRDLSTDELAANYAIDKERFNLP